jgi:hypothetical protein
MNDKLDSQTIDRQQDEYKVKNCLTCAHRFDDAHCELIECWEFSGWTAARYLEELRK